MPSIDDVYRGQPQSEGLSGDGKRTSGAVNDALRKPGHRCEHVIREEARGGDLCSQEFRVGAGSLELARCGQTGSRHLPSTVRDARQLQVRDRPRKDAANIRVVVGNDVVDDARVGIDRFDERR